MSRSFFVILRDDFLVLGNLILPIQQHQDGGGDKHSHQAGN